MRSIITDGVLLAGAPIYVLLFILTAWCREDPSRHLTADKLSIENSWRVKAACKEGGVVEQVDRDTPQRVTPRPRGRTTASSRIP